MHSYTFKRVRHERTYSCNKTSGSGDGIVRETSGQCFGDELLDVVTKSNGHHGEDRDHVEDCRLKMRESCWGQRTGEEHNPELDKHRKVAAVGEIAAPASLRVRSEEIKHLTYTKSSVSAPVKGCKRKSMRTEYKCPQESENKVKQGGNKQATTRNKADSALRAHGLSNVGQHPVEV